MVFFWFKYKKRYLRVTHPSPHWLGDSLRDSPTSDRGASRIEFGWFWCVFSLMCVWAVRGMPKPAPAALLGGPFPGDQVQAPVPQPPMREAGRVLQDGVMQHSDEGAHRPAPGGGVCAHIIAEHSGVSVCVCIANTSLNSIAGDFTIIF